MSVPHPPRHAGVDRCPGALTTHPAADGGLARVRVPGGRLSLASLGALRRASAAWSTGALDLTVRANVEIRGLAENGAHSLGVELAAAGLLPSRTHERARNILASPMAGLDDAGTTVVGELVADLDRALCATPELADLPGRFLIALDDGRGDVLGANADVTLMGAAPESFVVVLAGCDTGLRIAPGDAAAVAVAAARAFLAERAHQRSEAWRIRELADGPARVAARLGIVPGVQVVEPQPLPAPIGRQSTPPGVLPCAEGHAAVSVLAPLGRLSSPALDVLDRACADGAGELRLTRWRGIVVPGLTIAAATRWLAEFADAGLVVADDDPLATVSACTGRPGCDRALADVRADALAAAAAPGDDGGPVHWSGCERGCGRPADTILDMVATDSGYRRTARAAELVASGSRR